MTPDEFDHFRREAIAWRTQFAGNEAITERIGNVMGLNQARLNPVNPKHLADIDEKLSRQTPELYAEIAKALGKRGHQ